ncbi:hypothetical protein RFF30_08380 [Pasteurella multocida]|uniref:hypothetical protein n=1 Tax=Pasteurella multocida TaxID=747 RepID=UPI002B49DCEC|nr:hypothetical protein [Pasteurella multocida]MEB3476679.1 hypothetical protein [Pasteurella multocida]MEB3508193.1 hypothetical protein [Pasteurella multocida]WRJ98536.1 hypothetical protein RFF30_08380 [Pasteurella multocida]
MKKAIIKLTTVFGLSCLLIACGGGGGGSGNGGNNAPPPVQPIQPAPPAHQQPDAAPNIPAPPKDQAPDTGAEGGTKPQKSLENDNMAMSPPPSTQEKWEGACEAKSVCAAKNENKNRVTVYKLEYIENASLGTSTPDKYKKEEEHITLNLGDNSGGEYKFTLLGSDSNEVGYYGYRHNVDDSRAHKNVELLYAINTDFKSPDQSTQFKAYYKKEKGFIYAPISNTELSNNGLINYGDVNILYDNGSISGSIYRSENGNSRETNKEEIFKIEKGDHGSSTIEPVLENLLGTIKKGDKTNLNYILADSEKGKADHKYLFGNAKAETWIGVLAAEKSDEKPAENSTGK